MSSTRPIAQALTLAGLCLALAVPPAQAKSTRAASKAPPPVERCDGIELTQ